ADQLQARRIAVGDDRDLDPVGKRRGEVAQLAVSANGQRGLGQAGTDRRGRVGSCGATGQLQRSAVGKVDRDLLRRRLDPAMLPRVTPCDCSSLTSSFFALSANKGEVTTTSSPCGP